MEEGSIYAPYNFSWIIDSKLAGMAWPQTPANIRFLIKSDIKNLITLSPEMKPNVFGFPEMRWFEIPIREFEAPTVSQIKHFIKLCEEARERQEAVGVHCRMGRGRTGVMAACYLVHFYDQTPERAITNVRLMRPGSVETYTQEKAVGKYHDYLKGLKSL